MSDAVAVQVNAERVLIKGELTVPDVAAGLAVFVHGGGSGRFSAQTRAVAKVLERGGYATLLLDLLTREEDAIDARTAEHRFNVSRLGRRVVAALDWSASDPVLAPLPVACVGESTGAAASLIAAAMRPERVFAIISRDGRADLAGFALPEVQAPTLLIVGGDDQMAIELNQAAMRRMRAPVHLEIVPHASPLFDEPGAVAVVSELALGWCWQHLAPVST